MDGTDRWAFACKLEELRARGTIAVTIDRTRIGLFWHEDRPWAISAVCNHKGGPLATGARRGEYAVCSWHGWEFSVKTGAGPPGYDSDVVPTHPVQVREAEVWVNLTPATPRQVAKHDPHPLARRVVHEAHDRPRVLGISTTVMDAGLPRFSTSDFLLEESLAHAARAMNAETKLLRLRDLAFRPCEGNYSKAARACTWPCAITERDPADQLTPVYDGIVHWADVVLVATPIRWGAPSSLYTKMVERLNCVQNQVTIANKVLIERKVAAFIITGGQDNVQAVAGQLMVFFAEIGFVFPPFPFIAHSRGWTAEDMDRNVKSVQTSEHLRRGARELVARAMESSLQLQPPRHFDRGGRKASPEPGQEQLPVA